MESFKGQRLTVHFAEEDPEANLNEVIARMPNLNTEKRKKWFSKVVALIDYFANVDQLKSPDQFRKEAELPDKKHFYAIRCNRIRAYGWFGEQGDFFISHFAFKEGEELSDADTNRVKRNWRGRR